MGSIIRRAGLFAAALVAFAGSSAMASTLEVKVPFPFVVHGQTLPAGTYRLETAAIDPAVVLIRGEKGNTAAMLVMTTPAAGHDPAGDKPVLTFKRHETQYRLVDIWDSATQGREIPGL